MQEIFAVLIALAYSAHTLIQRSVLRLSKINAASYGVLYHFASALLLLPLLLFYKFAPSSQEGWLYAAAGVLAWTVWSIFSYSNIKHNQAPRMAVLNRSEIVFVTILSVIFFHEALTPNKLAALALMLAGAVILSYDSQSFKFDRAALLVLLNAFIYSIAFVADKAALAFFEPPAYAFAVYAFPFFLLLAYSRKSFSTHINNLSGSRKWLATNVLVTIIAYVVQLYLLKATTAITTAIIIELYFPLTVLGGIFLLKEKRDLKKVVLATVLSLAGTILVLA